jgi:hypothetical protein
VTKPPFYFEDIRAKAFRRWEQLEGDPELAGPWHQLFKQVQSPRHVLSELLQNADDVKAKNAWARIDNGEFIFEHDGIDFKEIDFASLCKFGFSNKRNLATIGFRGIGFKSTFSIGDEVRLLTPTLSVLFRRKHFTEPTWVDYDCPSGTTQVRVQVKDDYRLQELEKNLNEWATNPISLLFFRHVEHLTIQGTHIHRHSVAPGPVEGSEWVKLSESQEMPFLLIRSAPEPFPQDAIDEIRQERMGADNLELPPCRIDLVVGIEGPQRLFAVLPAGVETELPFACNAPFVQDPARLKIKEIEMSPTNRWLLERAGRLAAETMITWLKSEDIDPEERSKAYLLFPYADRDNTSLEGVCATTCEEAFGVAIKDTEFLLTETHTLVGKGGCITVPSELYNIWKSDQLSVLLDKKARPLLCRYVAPESLQKLVHWHMVDEIEKSAVIDVFSLKSLPKPDTWRQLLLLWDFIYDEVRQHRYTRYYFRHEKLRIFPVRGKTILYPSSSVIRLGEKRLLSSKEDWEFLSDYLLVLNRKWPRFLAEQRRKVKEYGDEALQSQVENAYEVLSILRMNEATDVSQVIDMVTSKFFLDDGRSVEDCIRLAHIAAALGASVPLNFKYVTRNLQRLAAEKRVLADVNGDLDCFVNDEWYEEHILHENYWDGFTSCPRAEWNQWIRSERSRLLTFISPQPTRTTIWGRSEVREFLKDRGFTQEPDFPYVTNHFYIDDWDFGDEHWNHWKTLAEEDKEFWGKLFLRILEMPPRQWSKALSALALQVATTGSTKSITHRELLPDWIIKFRNLACLQDTRGVYREPAELMRRTPETEPLLDVEPFIRADYDTEQIRPLLIKLGVRDSPTGPDRLLERLKALARAKIPPVYEVEKWYHRLDQIAHNCSTEEFQHIKDTFAAEDLILSESGEWVTSAEVFLTANEEDVPGAAVVHPLIRHLQLWQKVGIPERPTAQMAVDWLKGIPSGKKLDSDEIRRVRSLLTRYPDRVWRECGHWLNLDGQWIAANQLTFKLTMQSLVPCANLFPAIRRKTADFQRLSAETCKMHPFSDLRNLSACLENRIKDGFHDLAEPQQRPWIGALGMGLARIILDEEKEVERIQNYALRLAQTVWQPIQVLEVIPYIDGTPAGMARKVDALWKDDRLYVEGQQIPRLFKCVAQELARPFDRQDVAEAIKACIERPAEFVTEYLEENFKLQPFERVGSTRNSPAPQTQETTETGPHEGEKNQRPNEISVSQNQVSEEGGLEEKGDEPVISDENKEDGTDTASTTNQPHTPRPPKPKFIELYARAMGYERVGESDRFQHSDGSWLQRSDGGPFQFERFSSEGQLVQSYWMKDHCLLKNPLNLDAAVWSLCQSNPVKYTLILADPDNHPMELKGTQLMDLVKSGRITLYPAEYRLSYQEGHE